MDEVAAALKGWASAAIAIHTLRIVLVRVEGLVEG